MGKSSYTKGMKKILILLSLIISSSGQALEVPTLQGPVMDLAGVMDLGTKQAMEQKIRKIYQQGAGPQIQVLTINSLNGDNLEDFSIRTVTRWGLGNKDRDDGVLFLIVVQDRKMRIEVGQGLEGSLTDLKSRRITASLKSYFRDKQYGAGISSGLDQIIQVVNAPQAVQVPESNSVSKPVELDLSVIWMILGILVGIFVMARLGHRLGRLKYRRQDLHNLQGQLSYVQSQIAQTEVAQQTSLGEAIKRSEEELKRVQQELDNQVAQLRINQNQSSGCDNRKFDNLQNSLDQVLQAQTSVKEKIQYYQSLLRRKS